VADDIVQVPTDLTLLSDQELGELNDRAVAEFNRLSGEDVSPQALEYQIRLTAGIDRIRAESAGREARAQQEAEQERARMLQQRETLNSRVNGTADGMTGEEVATGHPSGVSAELLAQISEASARGATAALVAAIGDRHIRSSDLTTRATASLSEARRHAPVVQAPRQRLAVTAGVDVPGVARGSEMSFDDLVDAFQRVARTTPITRDGSGTERLVATIRNEFEHVVDDRTSPAQVQELINYLRRPEKMDSIVAGGGWCAPSEVRYEFFNVAGVDGLVDLPTVGVSRGGLKYPVSPSIADAFKNDAGATIGLAPFGATFSNASDPWLWTETDDIAAVTGSPTKKTLRAPCPTFNETRLECYGVTLTAGNLTDDAYPEATQHTLRLLLAAWQHAQNARIISQMVALSGAAITGIGGAGKPVFQTVVNGLDLACTDYRAKFAIPDETPLEVVAPFWVQDLISADLAWRNSFSTDLLSVTNADMQRFFTDRGLRVQWVNDWQVRGAGQFGNPSATMTAWPTSADFLVYAAGTFIKGNGLTLDLGVVRDSTLNATNDFTAAWSEECHLVAKVGNESRRYTMTFGVDGATGGSAYALGSPAAQV
jgi:hypothetical protein